MFPSCCSQTTNLKRGRSGRRRPHRRDTKHMKNRRRKTTPPVCRGRPVHSPHRESWVSGDSAFLSVSSLPPRLPTPESERVPLFPAAAPSHTIDRLPRAHPNSPAPSPTRRTLDSRNPKARPILPRVFPRDSHPCLLRNASRKKWTLLFGPFNRSSMPPPPPSSFLHPLQSRRRWPQRRPPPYPWRPPPP